MMLAGVEPAAVEPGQGTEAPNLYVGLDGTLVSSWLVASSEGQHALEWRSLRDGRWSSAAEVHRSGSFFVNWADVPAVTTDARGTLVATWLEQHEGGHGYGIRWSMAASGGVSWSDPIDLPEHRGGPEYGFVSFAATPSAELAVFWLDGRNSQGHDGGQMQLRGAVIGANGEVRERRLVDERVCDCCPTSAASSVSGPVVVYRDRSAREVRDIRIAGPGQEQSREVAADGWHIEGCPVNGPAVAVAEDELAVAWFSAASGDARVQVAFASLEGPFAAPIRVDLGRPVGRVDLEWIDAEHVVVSFIEDGGQAEDASLVVRTLGRDGSLGSPSAIARVPAARASGVPRMVRVGPRLWWAWTVVQPDGVSRVRLASAPKTALRGS